MNYYQFKLQNNLMDINTTIYKIKYNTYLQFSNDRSNK